MLKRIMGLLLSGCMISSLISVAAEGSVKNAESYEVLSKMKIVEKGIEERMTRAEFAQTIYNVKNFAIEKGADTSRSDNFFGDVADQFEIIEDKEAEHKFSDVDPFDQYTEAIDELVNTGIMRGVGDGKFAPERNVKTIEVINRTIG